MPLAIPESVSCILAQNFHVSMHKRNQLHAMFAPTKDRKGVQSEAKEIDADELLNTTLEEARTGVYQAFENYLGDHENDYVLFGGEMDSLSDGTEEHNRYGKNCYKEGTVYTGEIDGGIPHGKGNMIFQNGVVYAGEWKNGARHGRGQLKFPCGAIYEGGFRNGRFHGQGTYKAPSKSNIIQLNGSFEDGFTRGLATVYIQDDRRSSTQVFSIISQGFSVHDAIAYTENQLLDRQ